MVLVVLAILLLASCGRPQGDYIYGEEDNGDSFSRDYLEYEKNNDGNTPMNYMNRSIATQQGDWIYYLVSTYINYEPYTRILKTNEKTEESLLLYQTCGGISGLSVVGDYIYFCNRYDQTFYRMRTDGSQCEAVIDDKLIKVDSSLIINNRLYAITEMQKSASVSAYYMVEYNLDTFEDLSIVCELKTDSDIIGFCGNYIVCQEIVPDYKRYYRNIYIIDLSSNTSSELVAEGDNHCLMTGKLGLFDDTLFCFNGYSLVKYNLKTLQRTEVKYTHDLIINSVNITAPDRFIIGFGVPGLFGESTAEWIGIFSEEDLAKGEYIKVLEDQAYNICVVGDWLYYKARVSGDDIYCRVKVDGSNWELLCEGENGFAK